MIGAATILASTFDRRVQKIARANRGSTLDGILDFSEKMGRNKYGNLAGGLFYLGGLTIGDAELRETGQILLEALVANRFITNMLKRTIGRGRPDHPEGSGDWDFLEFTNDDANKSLPSGHTSTAFTIATVLSKRFDNIYASIALYSLASATAYQRIYSNNHWISDTVLGAIIGYTIGSKIVSLHEGLNNNSTKNHVNVYPYIANSIYGVGVRVGL